MLIGILFLCYSNTGLLCGMCKEGNGVSTLLNTCQSCISVGWLLIIILGMCTTVNYIYIYIYYIYIYIYCY